MLMGMAAKVLLCAASLLCWALPFFAQGTSSSQEMQRHWRQAQEFLGTNRPDLAAGEFRAILVLNPHNTDAQNGLGTLLYFQGDYPHAELELRAVLKSQPGQWKALTLLGMCEKRTGNLVGARADLEKAFAHLTEQKLRVEAGLELVEIYYAARDLDKAAEVVNVLRRLKPDDPGILYSARRIYSEQADEATLGIAMLAPKSAWMHQLIAQEMMKQGNTEAAILHYRDALKLDEHVPGLHFELAEVLSGSSLPAEKEQAEKEYQAALAESPFDEKAECRLGSIALSRSDTQSALVHYSRALQLTPDDPDANLGLGKTLLALNQPQKAQPLMERAVRLDPTDWVAHYRLGSLYRQMGRAEDARRELAEFQRLKQMRDRLKDVYKEMRLQSKPEPMDTDIPE
jgi:Flp pilus assembly protein TadD